MPKIGKGWLNETILFNIVRQIFGELDYMVVHHARPAFLRRQEFDIYIPDLKIAIEYQGKQHYEAIDFFGGKDALKKRQCLDEKKKRLCKNNHILLIEFKYYESLTEEYVLNKIIIHLEKAGIDYFDIVTMLKHPTKTD